MFVECLDGDTLTFIPKYMVTEKLYTHGLVQESSGFGSKQKGILMGQARSKS